MGSFQFSLSIIFLGMAVQVCMKTNTRFFNQRACPKGMKVLLMQKLKKENFSTVIGFSMDVKFCFTHFLSSE